MIPDWITVNKGSGESGETVVTITAAANPSTTARTATLTVRGTASGIEKTVSLSQAAQPAASFAWVLPSNGQRSGSSGLTSMWWLLEAVGVGEVGIGQASPMFNSYTITPYQSALYPRATHMVEMYFSENTGPARTGMFTVTASTALGYLTGNMSQEAGSGGQAAVSLTPTAVTVGAETGQTTFLISTTGTVTGLTATTDATWISRPLTITGNQLTVYYQANPGAAGRTATITLSGNGGAVTATATLTQNIAEPDITILSPTAKTVSATVTSVAFIYSVSGAVSNIAPVYTADWITNVTLDGHYLYIYCERNPEDTARTAQIRITGSTATGTVSATAILEQRGESLRLDPTTLTFGYNSGEIKTMSVYTQNNWTVIDIEDEQ